MSKLVQSNRRPCWQIVTTDADCSSILVSLVLSVRCVPTLTYTEEVRSKHIGEVAGSISAGAPTILSFVRFSSVPPSNHWGSVSNQTDHKSLSDSLLTNHPKFPAVYCEFMREPTLQQTTNTSRINKALTTNLHAELDERQQLQAPHFEPLKKAFPLQAWTGPWSSRRLRLQNF
jgi:hypothetical protein